MLLAAGTSFRSRDSRFLCPQRSSSMDVVENLEIYIPAEAEVKIVPLRSLPPSVLRRMDLPPSSSRQPADSPEVVWISPIVLRGRGQKPPEETEESKSQMYRLSRASSGPLRMSFVSANRAAYSVLKNGTPPRKRASSTQAAHSSHRDAIVVYRRRIYLSIRKQGHRQGQPPPNDMSAIPSTSYGPASGQMVTRHVQAVIVSSRKPEPSRNTSATELLLFYSCVSSSLSSESVFRLLSHSPRLFLGWETLTS